MTPDVISILPKEDIELFEKVRRVVWAMNDIELGNDEKCRPILLSCHMLARAIGVVFNLEHVDGYFAVGSQHSWNLTPRGHILDVYPFGMVGGPLLVENLYNNSPGKRLYDADKKRFRRNVVVIHTESFGRARDLVTAEAKRAYAELK